MAGVLAWPAGVWFAFEAVVRSAAGDPVGAVVAMGWLGLATATIVATKIRLASIEA
jgi:hypothetical protein